MSLSVLLDKTGALQRATAAVDASGGTTRTWAQTGSSFACAVWPANATTRADYARRDIVVTNEIVTNSDLGAKATDRVVVGGVTYLVQGVQVFGNAGVNGETVYQMDVERRIV